MKIAHLCLSCFYIDGFAYQENELAAQNRADGHDVLIIASTEQLDQNGTLHYGKPREYLGTDGITVCRLPYALKALGPAARKLRFYAGLRERLDAFAPDVILFHGASAGSIQTAARYVRDNPHVRLFVDSHEDSVNSARGLISKWLLHYSFYRPILLRSLPWIEKVLLVSLSCVELIRDFYGVPTEKLEFYPLGGEVQDDATYAALRRAKRDALGIGHEDVLIVQSGKMDRTKKLVEALEAFARTPAPQLKFVVAGKVHEDIAGRVEQLIAADSRIRAIGWQSAEELQSVLCAADVYCQPGTQSSTMQMAVCCRCAILLDDIPAHRPYQVGNGWFAGDPSSLAQHFAAIASCTRADFDRMSAASLELALRMLDYRVLAARLYR